MSEYIFTSESVSPGHPDKTCDQISDALLDYCLKQDPLARCAFECFATKGNVIIGGETRLAFPLTPEAVEGVVRDTLRKIGHKNDGFSYNAVKITNLIHTQSPDIAMGVDEAEGKDEGAGDQGMMFGYACCETAAFMPAAVYYSHKILENIWASDLLERGLGVDAKSQVSLRYFGGKPVGADSVTLSIQHLPELHAADVRAMVLPIIEATLPKGWMPKPERVFVNPTGRFVIGGPVSDAGLTGRKIIVDTYGGAAPHGGGAFSGKDPTKVDRSGAYMARYIAKNLVAAGVASRCTIQLSYVIGVAQPVSLYINTHETGLFPESKIEEFIRKALILTPKGIRTHLKLNAPIYLKTASFGHFGREPHEAEGHEFFTWEKTDLKEEIIRYFGMA